jgi:hypothetical protein
MKNFVNCTPLLLLSDKGECDKLDMQLQLNRICSQNVGLEMYWKAGSMKGNKELEG